MTTPTSPPAGHGTSDAEPCPTVARSIGAVHVARSDAAAYVATGDPVPPELPAATPVTNVLLLLRRLLRDAGLDSARYGTAEWNPLGAVVPPGSRVLLKPNWVINLQPANAASGESLVTHPSVIAATLAYLVKTRPARIIVGDAPVQGCDFGQLSSQCSLPDIVSRFAGIGHRVEISDFRLTKMPRGRYAGQEEHCRDLGQYCLFDLGESSWLTPITGTGTEFRVADYDPRGLMENHRPGTHRYLVAREVIDADVILSLPKLKTHKKAGVTGALKNMVGINGFKDYLPHHRKGSAPAGGDCYERSSFLKALAENCLDAANRSRAKTARYAFFNLAAAANKLDALLLAGNLNIDGSWHGNDTVWRMCLDLQRIVHYGRKDGTLAGTRQRTVLTITDGLIAGEGDGPLFPVPVPLGIMTFGDDVAALEWVHALLMGLEPERIPLLTHAFARGAWPLTNVSPRDIRVCVDGEVLRNARDVSRFGKVFTPPGWLEGLV